MSFGSVNTPGGWLVALKRQLSDLVTRMTSAERTISGLSGLSSTAVPNTRKINNKPLSSDITLTASDVGALTQTQADDRYLQTSGGTMEGTIDMNARAIENIGSLRFYIPSRRPVYPDSYTGLFPLVSVESLYSPDGSSKDVGIIKGVQFIKEGVMGHFYTATPTSADHAANKAYVDGKAAEITPGSIGAADRNHTHTAYEVGAADKNHTHTAYEVGAADRNHYHTAGDVGARPADWMPDAVDVGAIPTSAKGAAGGVATLDATGKVPASQLPAAATTAAFVAGSTAPTDKTKLWIHTGTAAGGLKYWNGSAWVHVPVAYS